MANEKMREYWNGEFVESWVRAQAAYNAMLEPFNDAILGAGPVRAGDRVVDVGCGSGALARAAGVVVGAAGSVTGLDISEPMLGLARDLSAGFAQVRFVCCDAQSEDLSDIAADVVVSRFGVMFFEDPVAAFANLAAATANGGRLAFACWRPALENEWITVPLRAVVAVVGAPDLPAPGAPGPFQMGDADFVRETLSAAGWDGVELSRFDTRMCPGGARDVDGAVRFLTEDAVGRALLADKPDDVRARAVAAVREALAPHWTEDHGVLLGAAAWIVTARLPS